MKNKNNLKSLQLRKSLISKLDSIKLYGGDGTDATVGKTLTGSQMRICMSAVQGDICR